MKIVFLEAVQNFGGSKRSFLEFAKELQKMGHDVLIVDFWGANKEFRKATITQGLPLEVLVPVDKPFVIGTGNLRNRILNVFKYIHQRNLYKNKFNKIIEEFQPDHVCVNSAKTLDILEQSSKYKIDYYVRGWSIGNDFKERVLFRKFSPRFIAISEATRHAIYLQREVSLKDIKVLKAYVSEHPVKKPEIDQRLLFNKNNPFSLLHAGTFVETKGHHISILTAKLLKEKNIHFKMKLAGLISPSEESESYYLILKKMVSDYGLENEVEFIVNNHDLSQIMSETNVLINPSYTEGLSRVSLEAMSKGKPVIANPVGGIIDFVISGFSGYLVDFNDVESFAERVNRYYSNPSLYKQHCYNAIDIINNGYLKVHINENLNSIYKVCSD